MNKQLQTEYIEYDTFPIHEFADLVPEDTNLSCVILIERTNELVVKFQNNTCNKLNGDELITITIQDPHINLDDFKKLNLTPMEVEKIKRWIALNENILLMYIYGEITTKQLYLSIQPLPKILSIAWVDKINNRCCWVECESDYFIYVNCHIYHKGDSMVRISLLQPKYLDHKAMEGKKPWKLTNKEKKELISIMQKPNKTFPNCTNWQITLAQYNMDNFGIDLIDTINGVFDKQEYPKAFDINTPMPDYTQL